MVQTVTINDAARLKGVSRQAVHAAIKAEKLETVTVEVPATRVTRKSLNAWQPNANMKRAGRPVRRYCGKCEASLTSTDLSNGACTQCGHVLRG